MRISPLDIRKQAFKKTLRGVDADEVRIFLELVASEYEKVLQENAMMAERLHHQEERLTEYRELEKSMRNSLVTADRIAAESRDSSEREAARIVQDAQLRAERILEDARERLQGLIREIEALKGKKEVYARRFWTLVEGQIGMIQEHMQDMGEVDVLRHRVEQLIHQVHTESFVPEPPPSQMAAVSPPEEIEEPRVLAAPVPSAAAPDPGAERPRSLPRGLGRLLQSRQSNLPLEERPRIAERDSYPERDSERALFPIQERREGHVELTAREHPLDGEAVRNRESTAGPRP